MLRITPSLRNNKVWTFLIIYRFSQPAQKYEYRDSAADGRVFFGPACLAEGLYRTDEDALTREIVALASEYGRYGYRRITAVLRDRGWHVGKDRVQRIWRREGRRN
jgi:HTH-like domain